MNVGKLQWALDFALKTHRDLTTESPVLITVKAPSMGPRASVGVFSAGAGMDWENGEFRIEPDEKLFKTSRMDEKTGVLEYNDNGKRWYACMRCRLRVSRTDNYCKHCGQRLQ